MIGKCPNCGIKLKEPPFINRETNEVMLTLRYREFIDNNRELASVKKAGYCVICNAKTEDIKLQNKKSIGLKPEVFFKPQIWKNRPKGRGIKPNLSNKNI